MVKMKGCWSGGYALHLQSLVPVQRLTRAVQLPCHIVNLVDLSRIIDAHADVKCIAMTCCSAYIMQSLAIAMHQGIFVRTRNQLWTVQSLTNNDQDCRLKVALSHTIFCAPLY